MREADRIEYAQANQLCYVCAHNSGALKKLHGHCYKGGLNPAKTEQFAKRRTAYESQGFSAWSEVSWATRCPRFTAIATELAA